MSERCASYTFTLRQLGPRDEIVLKSVIRLLQSKTKHTWLLGEDGVADLILLGDQPLAGQAAMASGTVQQAVVRFNSAGRREPNALAWPIRTDELLKRLDEAGEQIDRRHQLPGAALPAKAPSAGLPAEVASQLSAASGLSGVPLMQRLALLRWPDAALLQRDARFTKLATILTGRPVNLVELAARSASPLEVCQGFADLLTAAGLLRIVEPAALAQSSGAQAEFANPSPRTPSAGLATRPAVQAPRGLISRIRQRLEMIIGAPADRQARP